MDIYYQNWFIYIIISYICHNCNFSFVICNHICDIGNFTDTCNYICVINTYTCYNLDDTCITSTCICAIVNTPVYTYNCYIFNYTDFIFHISHIHVCLKSSYFTTMLPHLCTCIKIICKYPIITCTLSYKLHFLITVAIVI